MGSRGNASTGRALSFEDWIDEIGVAALAKKLKISVRSVLYWRTGDADPRVEHMRKIRELTDGAIGYDEILDRKSRLPQRGDR